MLIGYGALVYFNPQINPEVIDPIFEKIEDKLPEGFPITTVSAMFIYKFITVIITYTTGYKFIFDENPRPPEEPTLFTDSERRSLQDFRWGRMYKPEDIGRPETKTFSPTDDLSEDAQDEVNDLFSISENVETPRINTINLPPINSENRPNLGNSPFSRTR